MRVRTHVPTLHTCKTCILTQGSARSAPDLSHTHAKELLGTKLFQCEKRGKHACTAPPSFLHMPSLGLLLYLSPQTLRRPTLREGEIRIYPKTLNAPAPQQGCASTCLPAHPFTHNMRTSKPDHKQCTLPDTLLAHPNTFAQQNYYTDMQLIPGVLAYQHDALRPTLKPCTMLARQRPRARARSEAFVWHYVAPLLAPCHDVPTAGTSALPTAWRRTQSRYDADPPATGSATTSGSSYGWCSFTHAVSASSCAWRRVCRRHSTAHSLCS